MAIRGGLLFDRCCASASVWAGFSNLLSSCNADIVIYPLSFGNVRDRHAIIFAYGLQYFRVVGQVKLPFMFGRLLVGKLNIREIRACFRFIVGCINGKHICAFIRPLIGHKFNVDCKIFRRGINNLCLNGLILIRWNGSDLLGLRRQDNAEGQTGKYCC